MTTIIPHLFEAYLKCPTKSFLRALGETGAGNAYADWAHAQSVSYQHEGAMRLREGFARDDCNAGPLDRNALKSAKWRVAIDSKVCVQNLESTIQALKRVPCDTPGRQAKFTPIRFIFTNTLARHDRLLLAFDTLVLSETLGREVDLGEIIHGDDCVTLRVRTAALHSGVRKIAAEITTLLSSQAAPDLVLNRHCAECEFRDRCRQKAIESDDLSLLSNMTESERKHFTHKGIFTVTQLSYTFRPRKRPKHMRDRREPYHHSLKALAIREHKIHIVGSPTLTVSGTPVFLDVECVPDRGFYYLIGMRVSKNGSFIQHSFWADTPQDERRIWTEFLQTLGQLDNPVLLHYGSFESTFLRRMRERYPDAEDTAAFVAKVSTDAVNVLAFIYGQVYFPTYSNGLKEIAGSLGFEWPDPSGTGPTSVFWRYQWDESLAPELRQKLLAYNAADCEALELLTNALGRLPSRPTDSQQCLQGREIAFVTTELPNVFSHPSWQPFKGAMPELDAINQAAHWDYQRDRIYLRSKTSLNRKAQKRHAHERLSQGVEQILSCPERPVCPRCLRQSRRKVDRVSLLLQDLVFGSSSVKRRAVRHDFQQFWCPQCECTFGLGERFKANTKFGWNLIALYFYMAVDICIPQRSVARIFQRLFNLFIPTGSGSYLKTRIAQYYDQTVQALLKRIVAGPVVHVDETKARIRGTTGYVWVFTNVCEVVYLYSDSREAGILETVIDDFHGVLVSDFYSAYDSIDCPQQKCLVHLLRDLNNDVLEHPYDEELKELVQSFAVLLRPMIETIDRFGLKERFLHKHVKTVDRFYKTLSIREYGSESALRCKDRFEKNRDKLFTFLKHDGVPWNNNNAEHAVKAYARLRTLFQGQSTPKAISEYLTLLSICETCRNRGIEFLEFLRSGERDIQAFAESKGSRRRASGTGGEAL